MRTVNYSEVLAGSAGLCGLGAEDIGTRELALFRAFHDRRLQVAWEIHRWPEICRLEQRLFRPKWNAATTYGGPTTSSAVERYDVATGNYYQSLQGANLNNAPTMAGVENSQWWALCSTQYAAPDWESGTVYGVGVQVRNPADQQYYQCFTAHTSGGSFDATKFGRLTPFDRYVGYDQVEDDGTVLTPLGEVLGAWDQSRRLTSKLVQFDYELSENGVQFTQLKHAIAFAWLEFRLRRPELSGETWAAGAVYTSGRQVYWVNETTSIGNFYTANQGTSAGDSPGSAPTKWDVVEIPYRLRGYLVAAGAADWLRGDGQDDKAMVREQEATGFLEAEADKVQRQEGQVRRMRWKS